MTQPTVLCSPCGVPGPVTDRGRASRRLSALTAVICGPLGAAQPDESVAEPVDLRCRLRHLQGSQRADASMP